MKIIVTENYEKMSEEGAKYIAALLKNKPDCILGLATGSTPVGMYKCLAKMNKEGEITFKDVTSYNLDEYYPLAPDHDQSYRYFMNNNLFYHVDIDLAKTHVPDGLAEDPAKMGAEYDAEIEAVGGIDLQVLGLGPNGHIAFNDPHVADFNDPKPIKMVDLDQKCRQQQVNDGCFAKIEDVPEYALTLTVPTMFSGKRLFCVVPAPSKADAVRATVMGPVGEVCPATVMRLHDNAILYCDSDSGKYIL